MKIFFCLFFLNTIFCNTQNPIVHFDLSAILRIHPAMQRFCPETGAFFRRHIPAESYSLVTGQTIKQLHELQGAISQKCEQTKKSFTHSTEQLRSQNLQMQKPAFDGIENIYPDYIDSIINIYQEYLQEKEKLLSKHFSRPRETSEAMQLIMTDLQNRISDLAFYHGVSLILQSPDSQHDMQRLLRTESWFSENCLPEKKSLPVSFTPPLLTQNNSLNEKAALWNLLQMEQEDRLPENISAFHSTDFTPVFLKTGDSEK
jgi:hypothetical protein